MGASERLGDICIHVPCMLMSVLIRVGGHLILGPLIPSIHFGHLLCSHLPEPINLMFSKYTSPPRRFSLRNSERVNTNLLAVNLQVGLPDKIQDNQCI